MQAEFADISRYDTFPKLLAYNAQNWPHEIAMREKEFGVWNAYSWSDYQSLVKNLALGMHKLGIAHGDSVGIIGDNRPEWVASEIPPTLCAR